MEQEITQPTDLDLQLFLAKELPEEIKILQPGDRVNNLLNTETVRFYWISKDNPRWVEVTPFEWLEIVHRVEAKLTDEQWSKYTIRFWKTKNNNLNTSMFRDVRQSEWKHIASSLMEILK